MVVAGGSVAGLTFAAEAARRGREVLVLEEDPEIGEPEKCDGLISLRGLRMYGYAPSTDCVQSQIFKAAIHSPSGTTVEISTDRLDIFVLDRSKYDKQLLSKAEDWGAVVKSGKRVNDVVATENAIRAKADQIYESSLFVDATGPAAAVKQKRDGIMPAAKYEVEGDWFEEHKVEVFIDQERYPGFFVWVIPTGKRMAKVGVAGRGINTFKTLDSFLSDKDQRVVRKVAAPIYIGGPVQQFVSGRNVNVGESAGLVKPTTAGGILTSVASSVIAARWSDEALQQDNLGLLERYQLDWETRFGKEFQMMKRMRRVYENLSNDDIDAVLDALSSPKVLEKLSSSDFDFHASSVLGALGLRGLLKVAKAVAGAGVKELVEFLK
jgi:geranylgeranyl reductase family protein